MTEPAVPAPETDTPRARRVLVLSADLGGGHDALAAGLRREVLERDPSAEVVVENGLALASAHLHEFAREGYRSTVDRTPWTYGLWFWVLSATAIARIVRWAAWRGMRRRITRRIGEVEPDVVVSTYPFMTAVLGKLRREGDLHVPAVGLLIDSGPHDLWIAPGIDLHVTMNPADEARARAVYPPQRYYPPLHVTSARPAVDPRCFEAHDHDDHLATRAAFDVPLDARVLLVSGGSWGLALDDRDFAALVDETETFLVVACGRNDELADRLERELPRERGRVVRFTTEMPSLLAACDAALLNAGGMTCHECFALGTPVLLFDPLAGHGVSAARALEQDGLARFVRTRAELVAAVGAVGLAPGTAGARVDERDAPAAVAERVAKARTLREQPALADVVLAAQLEAIPEGAALTTRAGRTLAQRAGLLLVVATAFGIGASIWAQRHAIADFDWSVDPAVIVVAVLLFAIGPLTQAVSFWTLLRLVGVSRVRLREALAVWSWSSLARYAPSGLGSYVVRLRAVDRLRSTRRQVLAASVYEQALVPVAGATFSVAGFLVAGSHVPRAVAAVALVGSVLLVVARPKVLGGRLLALVNRGRTGDEALPQLPRGRGLALVVTLNIAGWLGTGAGAATLLGALGHHAPDLPWVFGAYAFAWMVGYLTPMAPGGLGVREGILASELAPHYGVGVAVSLALGLRIVHTLGDLTSSTLVELGYRLGTRSDGPGPDGTGADDDSRIDIAVDRLRGLLRAGLD